MRNDIPVEEQKGTKKWCEPKIGDIIKSYILKRENIYFICSTLLKPEVIIECCKHYNIDIKRGAFIDDRINVLRKAETLWIDY